MLDEKIERRIQQHRSETEMTRDLERAMDQPSKEPDVKLLSLGVGSLVSKQDEDKIAQYEAMHIALRAVPDRLENDRFALYVSNVSQTSASSLETTR